MSGHGETGQREMRDIECTSDDVSRMLALLRRSRSRQQFSVGSIVLTVNRSLVAPALPGTAMGQTGTVM